MKKNLCTALILLAALLVNAQTILVLQPGIVTGMNSEISSYPANLNNNYGNYGVISSYVWTNGSDTFVERALLQFNLSLIPSGANIISAYLDLWASPPGNTFGGILPSMQGTDNASFVRRITQPWNAYTVTWNNQPSETNSNQIILPTSTSGSQNYLHNNVTSLVQDMLTYGNNGFMIEPITTEPDNSMLFNSSNFPDTTLSPRLTITYSMCSATTALSLGPDTNLCTGQTLLLNAASPNSTYVWQDNSSQPTYLVSTAGNYSVTVTDSGGCSVSASVNVGYATGPPVISLGPDKTICADSLVLRPGAANTGYKWSDNSTDSILTINSSGTYSVTASNGCGTASATVNVTLLRDQCALLVPTAFSPNGDGKNDIFSAISHCPTNNFSMHIYNRWGEQVYQSQDITVGWDGTFKGIPQPVGTFVYYIESYNYCTSAVELRKGSVTLLR